jgi:hypothetical protein
MNNNKILRFANIFYSIASTEKEELPENSKDLKVVKKNIEDLKTFQARKKYAEKNLKHLSSGSSRIVYLTKEKTIFKLAKNDKGLAQNKAEANPKVKSKYLNKVLSHSKDYSWIETVYRKKITEKQFKKQTGISFDDWGDCIRYGLRDISSNSNKEKPEEFDEVSKTNLYKEMEEVGKKNKLMGGDLARISSWCTDGEKPILIDSGLTKEIFEKYYET